MTDIRTALAPFTINGLAMVNEGAGSKDGVAIDGRAVMPNQNEQNQEEENNTDGRADGEGRGLVGGRRLTGTVPKHSGAHKDKKQRPKMSKNRPRMKIGIGTRKQRHDAKTNEEQRKDHRTAPDTAILGHHRPLSI